MLVVREDVAVAGLVVLEEVEEVDGFPLTLLGRALGERIGECFLLMEDCSGALGNLCTPLQDCLSCTRAWDLSAN